MDQKREESADTIGIVSSPRDLPAISLQVLPVDVTEKRDTDVVVRISVSEPEERSMSRLPVDVVAVIDISGSMGQDAIYEVDGEERCDDLRILDVAVHAVKVIVESLRKEDRFALVAFDQTAELKYPLTNMNASSRNQATKVANGLKQRGQTNIWGGIVKGLDSLRTAKADSNYPLRNQVVLLLTDGQPTTKPREGHVKAFENYCRRNDFKCLLSCFGFGYSLDSKLMMEMAQVGSGTYAFIPMAPVLGTVFTNALASVLSTYTTNSKLILTSGEGGSFVSGKVFKGGLETRARPEKMWIEVGPLLFGQHRDVVIPMQFNWRIRQLKNSKNNVLVKAKLEFDGYEYGKPISKVLTDRGRICGYDSDGEVAKIRCVVTDTLLKVVDLGESGKLQDAEKVLKNLVKFMDESKEACDERVVGLKRDVGGRCTKALDGKARFNRWGKHYIRALLRAHAVQQCTNKLDIGVQVYGGSLFALMRQKGDDLFLKLPPPQPLFPRCKICGKIFSRDRIEAHASQCTGSYGSNTPPAPVPARKVNINNYTGGGGGGGCFGAESTVVVVKEDGEADTVRVADVKKGDIVKVSGHETAKVVCVVAAIRKDPNPLVAIPGGPFITSKHPIRVNGNWRMPEGMGKMVEAGGNGTVYNFVMEPRNAILLVNGYECVGLGHELTGKIVEHSFYGTVKSINEVQKLKGWTDGRVLIEKTVRDKQGHSKAFN